MISIKIGVPEATVELNARKALDGSLLIMDHSKIDIAVQPSTMKVVTFPKSIATEDVYEYQNRLLEMLADQGIVDRASIQGGNVFRSLEEATVHRMSERIKPEPQTKMEPLDSLTYKSFIGKFNNKYGDLLKEQQDLLNRYITSFADDGLEMRLYLNEELSRLKGALSAASSAETEAMISEKINGVIDYLESLRKRDFVDQDLQKILKAQELTEEISADDIN